MAWRSSGTTNDEMVDNLNRFGVITSPEVEAAFRSVDRKYFVPKNQQNLAHKDQPIKDGNVHLSAPHIYGSVLEALELKRNSSITFLNAGSGSGYLTCIVASILGPRSIHYGVEVHADVNQHAQASIAAWKKAHPEGRKIEHLHLIHGNALELQADEGECALGFDRIYIGAAIGSESLSLFKKMLKPGGILVGPVDDELVKVIRSQRSTAGDGDEFAVQIISAVRFAPLISRPAIETFIPARVWSPEEHAIYPDSFRQACKQVLMCSNAKRDQPTRPQPKQRVNAAALLPRALWMEVLSYTHRDWFETPQSEVELLRRQLAEERANVERANAARLEAERRCHAAEKERDVYRILARRWKSRIQASSGGGNDDSETIEEAAAAMLLGSRESGSLLGFGNIFRRFRNRGSMAARREQSEEDSDENDDEEEDEYSDASDRMEEDNVDDDVMSDEASSEGEDEANNEESDFSSMASSQEDSTIDFMGAIGKTNRSQTSTATTVSLSGSEF